MRRNANPKKKSGGNVATMKVSRRIIDSKMHTRGYVISGKNYTPRQAAQLARSGKIAGVRAVGNHIQAQDGRRRLTDLPTTKA